MFCSLKDRKFSVSGIGIVSYNDKLIPIFLHKELDTCIKNIDNGSHDVGVEDSRNLTNCLTVKLSSFETAIILSGVSLLSYFIYKMVKS